MFTRKNFRLPAIFFSMLLIFVWLPKIGSAADGTAKVVIFHTNDTHARVTADDDNGKSIGLAEMSAAVKSVKAKNPDTLWFDAGDTFHGMPRINISNGENLVPLLNLAGVNVFVPGNHDFDYSSAQLERLAKNLKFPTLSANVVRKSNGKNVFKPYKIFKLPNNIKVGVFGLTTPDTVSSTAPRNIETINFLDPVDAAKDMVKKLRPKCDILIAVMHMGIDTDASVTSYQIVRAVSGIDLIVDGHSHTALAEGMAVGDTLIVQTGSHGYNLGQVTINLRDHKIISKKAQLLDKKAVAGIAPEPDAEIKNAIAEIDERNEKILNEVIIHSDRVLTSERQIVRRYESELGNLYADAIRWETGADIAVANSGGLRADLPAGDVTRKDVLAVLPFGNSLKKCEISGRTIREMLENSVHAYPDVFGGFLNVSGMTFSFDSGRPVGQRVEEIFVNGQPLDEDKIYTIGTIDFMFEGGDGYDMLKNLKAVGKFSSDNDAFAAYIKKFGMSGIELGRIKNLSEVDNSLYAKERRAA